MRVLAGLVNVEGYIYKPSTHYHHLYSPIGHPTVSVSALNPDMQVCVCVYVCMHAQCMCY